MLSLLLKTVLTVFAISRIVYPLPEPILKEPVLSVSMRFIKASTASSIYISSIGKIPPLLSVIFSLLIAFSMKCISAGVVFSPYP